jgi:adhesin/invasin
LRGTVATTATVTATAVAGSAQANVVLVGDPSTARVVSVSASPTSVPADGTASTLVATVRDAYGNNVGANVGVSWGANGGSLSATSTVTNVNGQVAVAWSNTVAGAYTATAYAAAGSSSAVVTFVATTPVVSSFAISSSSGPNTLLIDSGTFYYVEGVLTWSAVNATRYEIVENWPGGRVIYSGTGTSMNLAGVALETNNFPTTFKLTLRAYNGSNVTTSTVVPQIYDQKCTTCGQ